MERSEIVESTRDKFRQKYAGLAFNSYINTALVIFVFTVSLALSGSNIDWRLSSCLMIPVFFLYAEGAMYVAHRWQQHRKIRFNERIFEMHAVWHHGMFASKKMYVDSFRDMNMVILPFFVHGPVLGLYAAGAILADRYFQSDVGWILMLSVALQLCWYEVVHAASHSKTPIGVFKTLAIHHQNHHNPKLMGKYNFSIATTIFDKLCGTVYSER